ncbi:single-stranded-DNA-specific exonuclease RecJ [Candidatus Roizmanbacteria bacterium CG_4_10_14_0_8_um_filter_33_9]|uniref:Single-stranded-DNA-specific exonuclease RecJ n=1 Tax=Candidatus Roizmanbacteria bacterium CG_4_10_14_0_8_um_filter_33_9 TaxID=1974826 RepID=A0A2M7QI21_9BACT|nr:MAG: single-stranded-DNA-specific exonuclease RecJ [Candidatus Roizmanbacteria bacterium CG_4_10_14_0_8_um_filter_33_9]
MKIHLKQEVKKSNSLSNEKIISILLKNREIVNTKLFLHPPHPSTFSLESFGFKKQISHLLKLLEQIRLNKETIVVYTDYDADGITGGTIMWETLHLLGFSVMPYVPHRKKEGYGFSTIGIDSVNNQYHPKLIISVDHGISGAKQISYAKKLGISIIVTDHHLKPKDEPKDAEAIFHIPSLSGSGVAYFVAKEILKHFSSLIANHQSLISHFNSDYLALASIGTIADLVPLTDISRSIVYHGLKTFQTIKRPGLKHILQEAKIDNKPITPYEIGYIIAPRINAVGRLKHAIDALRLLCTNDSNRASELAHQMGQTNKDRQDLVETTLKEAIEMVEKIIKKQKKIPIFIILKNKNWHEGIIGLIAGKITEKYYRPTLVLTKSDGFWKGSARSISALHMTDFLRTFEKHIISVGGHKQAAGLSVSDGNLDILIKSIEKSISKYLKDEGLEKQLSVDLKLPLGKASLELAKELELLEPFGMGNPQPLFLNDAQIIAISPLGKNGTHLKLILKDPSQSSFPLECVYFSAPKEAFSLKKGDSVQVVYNLDVNRWNGRERVQGKIITIA